MSFNYFESFCDIKLIDGSVAPYAYPIAEVDHLFGIVDYFDFITTGEGAMLELSSLMELPEGQAFHFTASGAISDFTYLTAEGREFVVSGFSMVRHGTSLHWYLVGGEIYPEVEWEKLKDHQEELDPDHVPAPKRLFLSSAMKKYGNKRGPPVALEGTKRAMRMVVGGETNIQSRKHLGRIIMSEWERMFDVVCDDPDIFRDERDPAKRAEITKQIHERVEESAVLWNLAEAMFQLPSYFKFKVGVARSVLVSGGQKLAKVPKGGKGIGANFRYVSAIEFTDSSTPTVRPYIAPHYAVETEGFWRRLAREEYGEDANGNRVRGKTWIKETNDWRRRADEQKTIYVKSSVAAARLKANEYLDQAQAADRKSKQSDLPVAEGESGVIYVLRCTVMKDEVYKVGWTAGTAQERAQQLSAATGVPSSFAVVGTWQHRNPEGLERNIHAMLAPYRINDGREFFMASYPTIKSIVEAEIERVAQ